MRTTLIVLMAAVAVCTAIDIEILASGGTVFPTGQWGNSLSTGVAGGLTASWLATGSLRVGLGAEGSVFGSSGDGSATLSMLKPSLAVSYFLRPWGNIFNPGITCAFGMSRTSLSNGSGSDPATWDPFWSAGICWDFSVGAGFRGRVGTVYSSIMAEQETGDSFSILLGFSREVTI